MAGRGVGAQAGQREAPARRPVRHADADRRGKRGQGLARIEWIAREPGLDPAARPVPVVEAPEYARWESRGALGYLTMDAIVRAQLAAPPATVRLVVSDAAPTGALGTWVRRLAEGGLLAVLTASSPRRLAHPEG